TIHRRGWPRSVPMLAEVRPLTPGWMLVSKVPRMTSVGTFGRAHQAHYVRPAARVRLQGESAKFPPPNRYFSLADARPGGVADTLKIELMGPAKPVRLVAARIARLLSPRDSSWLYSFHPNPRNRRGGRFRSSPCSSASPPANHRRVTLF